MVKAAILEWHRREKFQSVLTLAFFVIVASVIGVMLYWGYTFRSQVKAEKLNGLAILTSVKAKEISGSEIPLDWQNNEFDARMRDKMGWFEFDSIDLELIDLFESQQGKLYCYSRSRSNKKTSPKYRECGEISKETYRNGRFLNVGTDETGKRVFASAGLIMAREFDGSETLMVLKYSIDVDEVYGKIRRLELFAWGFQTLMLLLIMLAGCFISRSYTKAVEVIVIQRERAEVAENRLRVAIAANKPEFY